MHFDETIRFCTLSFVGQAVLEAVSLGDPREASSSLSLNKFVILNQNVFYKQISNEPTVGCSLIGLMHVEIRYQAI